MYTTYILSARKIKERSSIKNFLSSTGSIYILVI